MNRTEPVQPRPRDVRIPWRMHGGALAVAIPALAGLAWVGASPERVERLFVNGFGTATTRVVSATTAWLPFSLAEICYLAIGAWIVLSPLAALWDVARRRRRPLNALASGAAQVASVGSLALVGFYGLWGLNYARAPAADRLGFDTVELDDPGAEDEVARLAEALVYVANERYVDLHGSPDGETPTEPPPGYDIDAIFDAAYVRVAEELDLPASFAAPRGPVKPLLSSTVFSWLGIGGVYFPFTGEANYNTLPPTWSQAHTIAHEKAHQRGIASEDEANFFGFLACIRSGDPFAEYSGWMFAQRRLLSTLMTANPERAQALIARRHPGVQEDVNASRAFWASWDGAGHTVGSTVNDVYLLTNGVEGGVLSYGLSARLVVGYARHLGGDLSSPPAR